MCRFKSCFRIVLLTIFVAATGALVSVGDEPVNPLQARRDKIMVEALLRLPKESVPKDEKTALLVSRFLKQCKDGATIIKVIRHCEPADANGLLWTFATSEQATDSTAVEAISLLLERGGKEVVAKWIHENLENIEANSMLQRIGLTNRPELTDLLAPLVDDPKVAPGLVATAALSLSRSASGQKMLIELAKDGKLRGDAKSLVASSIRNSSDKAISEAAKDLFPLPMSKDQKPLPPIDELAKRVGNAQGGKKLFTGLATCANCHVVRGVGKGVGPDLSEIGSKLTREAMLVAILDPSAGISHNYETFAVQTDSGEVGTGLLVSQTEEEIILKDAQGIERKYPREEVLEFKKQEKSLMPENLHHNFDEQGLVDIVEYMLSLKKE
jgi:putative heme-binding domain-containing protein